MRKESQRYTKILIHASVLVIRPYPLPISYRDSSKEMGTSLPPFFKMAKKLNQYVKEHLPGNGN